MLYLYHIRWYVLCYFAFYFCLKYAYLDRIFVYKTHIKTQQPQTVSSTLDANIYNTVCYGHYLHIVFIGEVIFYLLKKELKLLCC